MKECPSNISMFNALTSLGTAVCKVIMIKSNVLVGKIKITKRTTSNSSSHPLPEEKQMSENTNKPMSDDLKCLTLHSGTRKIRIV